MQKTACERGALGHRYVITSEHFVSAVGQLNTPYIPEIPSINMFEGKMTHLIDWDPSEFLQGKRVAVIGTGASGVQLIPKAVSQAERGIVFQRSTNWIVPRNSRMISAWRQI